MTARRFLGTALLATVLTVGVFAAVTTIVDPYDYWGRPRHEGLNARKPMVHTHLTAVKQRQYLRQKPRTVIAGNSRVDVGLNPGSALWPKEHGPVYNLGLPGASMTAVAEALATAMAAHKPERVFLGVDFLDFLLTRDRWAEQAIGPLRAQPQGVSRQARQLAETTLSLDALIHSGLTLLEQRKTHPADTRPDGFTPLENYHDHVRMEGHAALFEQRSRELVQRMLREPRRLDWNAADNNSTGDGNSTGGNMMWTRLEQFLHLAQKQGVEVVLFTYPYHAELLETLRQTGKGPDLRQWLARLAELAAREGVTLWSFTGYDEWSTEAVPPPGDRTTRMRWYWEAGHFKPALGELMIARMLERPDAPAGFGQKLTPDRGEALTAALTAALAAGAEGYRVRPGTSSERVAAYVSEINGAEIAQAELPEGKALTSGGM